MYSPRWRKVLRDLTGNKTRTALVTVCLALGIFTISFLINTESMLRSDFNREFAAANPSSATLRIPGGFDRDLVQAVRRMPEIAQAEGRRSTNVRLKVGTDQWISLNITGIRDFRDIRVDKVKPYNGTFPPADGEILIERSSMRLADLKNLNPGVRLTIQTAESEESTLRFTGQVLDFNRTPSMGTGIAYGYVTLDTFARLGKPTAMDDLRVVVAQDKLDKEHIRQVANQVKNVAEDGGKKVYSIAIPDPGVHPLGIILDAMEIVFGTLGALSLFGGALLVFNSIVALLAQQVRQIGMMKAVGARAGQLIGMYLGMVTIFGLIALAVSTPLAFIAGAQAAKWLADFFNLDLTTAQIPLQAFAVQALIGLAVPSLAAIYPIWSGARVTVREAISDYGIQNSQVKILKSKLPITVYQLFSRPVLISLRNTFRRRARLVLTLLPLALSGAIFISVINVRTSLQNELNDIFANKTYDVDISFDESYRIGKIESAALGVPGVSRVEGYHATGDAYRLRADSTQGKGIAVYGLAPSTTLLRLPVIDGRWLAAGDEGAVVINDAFSRDEPDLRVGDEAPFRINGRKATLQIIGIVREKMAPSIIYMNDSYFAKTFANVGRTNRVWVVADPSASDIDFKPVLEAAFDQAGMRVASITPASSQRDFVDFHFSIMIVPLGAAALVLALVGGLGLMGTMSANVIERQREIGVMRAIGASDGGVQQIFLVEGLIIGLISWVLSVAGSVLPTALLDEMVGVRFLKAPMALTLTLGGVLTWLIIVVATAALSCYLPARNASQTGVRELLAYE